jgi:hypothetical protein
MTPRILPRAGWPATLATLATAAAAIGAAVGAAGCNACSKTPPEPAGASGDASAMTGATASATPHLARDDAGHLMPRMPPPPIALDATVPDQPKREPDWDLESDDPARDYVRRYALGTRRYGDTLDCIDVGPSQPAGDRRRVEVRTAAACPGAGAIRDVFLVDATLDRLTVDNKSTRDPLARWPDGSDPEGPAGPVREIGSLREWNGDMKNALQGQLLVPIRVQTYGRGTYPVVTLAGWHGAVVPGADPEALRSLSEALCRATHGAPMALFGGLDRSVILRVRCPGGTRWDKL